MSHAEMQAALESLRAENAKLKAAQAGSGQVKRKVSKDDGRVWFALTAIKGTGWGFSATREGWDAFMGNQKTYTDLIRAELGK